MWRAGTREKESEVVVDFSYRSDRGARIVSGALLLDRDGWREPLDHIHIRLLHEPEELPRVRAQRFHVAPLPLGVNRVEGQRRLSGPRESRDHRKAIARDLDVDVSQVVGAGASDDQLFFGHSQSKVGAAMEGDKTPHLRTAECDRSGLMCPERPVCPRTHRRTRLRMYRRGEAAARRCRTSTAVPRRVRTSGTGFAA